MITTRAPEKGLVSIIIAGEPPEADIEASVRSALDQTYATKEIVVVTAAWEAGRRAAGQETAPGVAGSGGGPPIPESAAPSVRRVTASEPGLAAARSEGVRATNGQFTAFLHPGDTWTPDKIARQVALLESQNDLDFIFTRARMQRPTTGPYIFPAPGGAWEAAFERGIAKRDPAGTYAKLVLGSFVPYSSILAKRMALPIEGPFRSHLRHLDEYDFVLRMSELKRFAFLDEPLTTCAPRPDVAPAGEIERSLEVLAILEDNLARNWWLARMEPAGLREREASLLKAAGSLLVGHGRGVEARPLLKRAWKMRPFDVGLTAQLLASLRPAARGAPAPTRPATD